MNLVGDEIMVFRKLIEHSWWGNPEIHKNYMEVVKKIK